MFLIRIALTALYYITSTAVVNLSPNNMATKRVVIVKRCENAKKAYCSLVVYSSSFSR